MKILATIGQERYFQILGANEVFAGLWVGKAIFRVTPIHVAARNQGKAIENGFQACRYIADIQMFINKKTVPIHHFP